jgi:dystroglycan 1
MMLTGGNVLAGLEATDSLVAEVHNAPMLRHVFEISMTLHMPLEAFAHSALKKREFIEKLQKLYGDKNASAISLLSISGNHKTTTVVWRNLSLPTYECPSQEVKRLSSVLVNDNKSFTEDLNREFNSNSHQPEFEVIQITVDNTGACSTVGLGRPKMPPIDDSTSVGASHDDYLVTFILPAIIIVAMLLLAGIIACILYKRRRSGKMSVSEKDDERQSFRSKGIPVIFQDELDEKPDTGRR